MKSREGSRDRVRGKGDGVGGTDERSRDSERQLRRTGTGKGTKHPTIYKIIVGADTWTYVRGVSETL